LGNRADPLYSDFDDQDAGMFVDEKPGKRVRDGGGRRAREAALRFCAEQPPPIHDRSKLARKPPGILALAFPKSREPQARLDALATNLIGLGQRRGGNVKRGGVSPTSDPISQSCDADVRGSE
jgi:hypothetical protein